MPPDVFVASLGGCVAAPHPDYCNRADLDTHGLVGGVACESVSERPRLVDVRVTIDLPHADVSGKKNAIKRVADRTLASDDLHPGASRCGDLRQTRLDCQTTSEEIPQR